MDHKRPTIPDVVDNAPRENLLASRLIAGCAGLAVIALLFGAYTARAQPAQLLPPPTLVLPLGAPVVRFSSPIAASTGLAEVVLAGGCFWGVQAVFQHTRGVLSAVSGYAGGSEEDAQYAQVSSGSTRRAEAVKITYDPSQVSLGELLQVFFSVAHDPTEGDRQGPDSGPQYRSAVFYETQAQRDFTKTYIVQLDAAQLLRAPIATEVTPLNGFFVAEAAHQDYAARNPHVPCITMHDAPKLKNLQALLPERYRSEPVLVETDASSNCS